MKNLYNDTQAKQYNDPLALRVYTSNLLGKEDRLVLHGGGNTSLKEHVDNQEVLFVKGSGWDLSNIQKEGFAPVVLGTLQKMATLPALSDSEMVSQQKAAMLDPNAPNPSVEAILHAIIPFRYVDHTHADAIVTISNSKHGKALIEEIFKDFLIVPYVMPGFILARTIYEMSQNLDWSRCKGIILHHHGIFTFDDDAKRSYTKMIDAVTHAEIFLEENAPLTLDHAIKPKNFNFSKLHQAFEKHRGEMVMQIDQSPLALTYASQKDLHTFATRGVLTPEHILRTKRIPLILTSESEIEKEIKAYQEAYQRYFQTYHSPGNIALDPSPNYAVIEGVGVVSFGKSEKEASIISDILTHTMEAVLRADQLGGYQSIDEKESFAMEYWELEQAKLKK